MIKLFVIALFSFSILATTNSESSTADLKFNKIMFVDYDIELSGIAIKNNFMHVVGDKLENHYIYRTVLSDSEIKLQPHVNLKKLDGHLSYMASATLSRDGGHLLKSPLDLEGIAYCDETWYLANEQTRHVLKINGKKLEVLPIDFAPSFANNGTPLESIDVNAGFEGIAIDCKNEILYLAQEREPRAIIVVDLKQNKVTDFYDIPVENLEPSVNMDFADLYFENGHLYILERNQYAITKFNPDTKTVISRVRFRNMGDFDLKDLYVTDKPFGMAEGLSMSSDTIYVGIDNNKSNITPAAIKKYKAKANNSSSVLFFQRPVGF